MLHDQMDLAVRGVKHVEMRRAIEKATASFQDANVDDSPHLKIILRLRDALISHGIHPSTCEQIALRMNIDVSKTAYQEHADQMDVMISAMASFIARFHEKLGQELRSVSVDEAIVTLASTFKVEMD